MADPPGNPPQKTTPKAVVAAFLALASVCACLVGGAVAWSTGSMLATGLVVVALPCVGLTACILGMLAVRDIQRGRGQVVGKVPALVGVFVGLLSAVLQGAVGIGLARTYMDIRNTLAPTVGQAFIAIDQHQPKVAEINFAAPDHAGPDSAALISIADKLHARLGACRGAIFDLSVFQSSLRLARSVPKEAAQSAAPPDDLPRPVRVVFEHGSVLALCFMDSKALENNEVKITDALLAVEPASGPFDARAAPPPVIVLRSDGPASKLAHSLGLTIE